MRWILILKAYIRLIEFEASFIRGDFGKIHSKTKACQVRPKNPAYTVEEVCVAIDTACMWYWKQVQCLQRSAAAACLLRRHGVSAQLVIGIQQTPFRAHAWVEVEGHVVNDRGCVQETYRVLDRC